LAHAAILALAGVRRGGAGRTAGVRAAAARDDDAAAAPDVCSAAAGRTRVPAHAAGVGAAARIGREAALIAIVVLPAAGGDERRSGDESKAPIPPRAHRNDCNRSVVVCFNQPRTTNKRPSLSSFKLVLSLL